MFFIEDTTAKHSTAFWLGFLEKFSELLCFGFVRHSSSQRNHIRASASPADGLTRTARVSVSWHGICLSLSIPITSDRLSIHNSAAAPPGQRPIYSVTVYHPQARRVVFLRASARTAKRVPAIVIRPMWS